MKSKKEIRAKIRELFEEGINNFSDYSKNRLSLARVKLAINSLRWVLGETEHIFVLPPKKHRRGKVRLNHRI